MTQDSKRNPDRSASQWSVNQWGSHPDLGHDDCMTGEDFDSLQLALASDTYQKAPFDIQYLEVDGPIGSGYHQVVLNPHYSAKAVRFQEEMDRSERAMQAGMGGGIHAYNDEMGYDSEDMGLEYEN
jgi:hypothetical protein